MKSHACFILVLALMLGAHAFAQTYPTKLIRIIVPFGVGGPNDLLARLVGQKLTVKEPVAGLVLSNAIRSAVTGLAKTLSRELAKDNILVNNVCPGRIHTERAQKLNEARAERLKRPFEEINREMAAEVSLGRYGTADEAADLIVFLASERASYITGTTIQIDGGLIRSLQ